MCTAPPSGCCPFLTSCRQQVRLGVVEGKRAPRDVQLSETWEQNQGKCAGEKRGHPELWPQGKVFVLWKKCNGVSSIPFTTSASVKACPLHLRCPVEV